MKGAPSRIATTCKNTANEITVTASSIVRFVNFLSADNSISSEPLPSAISLPDDASSPMHLRLFLRTFFITFGPLDFQLSTAKHKPAQTAQETMTKPAALTTRFAGGESVFHMSSHFRIPVRQQQCRTWQGMGREEMIVSVIRSDHEFDQSIGSEGGTCLCHHQPAVSRRPSQHNALLRSPDSGR